MAVHMCHIPSNTGKRFSTPPPPGSNFKDCQCARIETKASIHHPLWVVVVVYRIGNPINTLCLAPTARGKVEAEDVLAPGGERERGRDREPHNNNNNNNNNNKKKNSSSSSGGSSNTNIV